MTRTPELIDALVECAVPVRRLRPPILRAGLWLALAGVLLTLVAVVHGVRPDLAEALSRPAFAVGTAAALATGVLAAIAAFLLSIPDRSRWWLLLPVPTLTLWVSTVGYGCLADWVSLGPEGVHFGEELGCLAILVLTSVPLAVALTVMLRYAALLRAGSVTLAAALAVAAIAAAAVSMIHDHDASVLILIWNLGTAALIAGLGGLCGRAMLRWAASHLTLTHAD